MRPAKDRLSGRIYHNAISGTRKSLKISYSLMASWMGLTASNLRAMIHQNLNPTENEWLLFKVNLKTYIDYINNVTPINFLIPIDKIGKCECGCKRVFIKWSWNKRFDSKEHRHRYWKKHKAK